MAFHYQTFIADQPQEMKQKLTENLQATAAGSQPPQII